MSERLRSIKRIRAVQQTVRDLAEWKLAAAERARTEAGEARAALQAFVAEERPSGTLATAATRTLMRQVVRENEAEQARQEAARAKQRAEGRLKLSETLVDTLAAAERDAAERRRLDELMQALLARPPQPERD